MIAIGLATMGLILAAVPACIFWRNQALFTKPAWPPDDIATSRLPRTSVLIPARNEQETIEACLRSVLACPDFPTEVVVLDDHSQDQTAERVRNVARADRRVRLEKAPPLPPNWCGKQHACAELARRARCDLFVFLDADVQLTSQALVRLVWQYQQGSADLLSGFPHQQTGSFFERLLIPLIHFLLLGYLPLWRMRASRQPAYAAGCGQLFLTHRDAYQRSGGHAAIRHSLHDGIMLPRQYRRAGLSTDLVDASEIASCRMYYGAHQVWQGLAKNATEGIANRRLIVPFTLLLAGGHVLPFITLAIASSGQMAIVPLGLSALAVLLSYYPRLAAAQRFRQPVLTALLHPLSIVLFLTIQWHAFLRPPTRRSVSWKGRLYPAR